MIVVAGIGGGYFVHSLLVPSPRPVVVYPLAVVLSGALAALQFGRGRLGRALILGLAGSLAAAWIAALILPIPGPRISSEPMLWYHGVVMSVAAAQAGLVVGVVYSLVAAFVRRLRGQRAAEEIPLRFSLQTLLVAVTLLAMYFGGAVFRLQQFAQEKKLADHWSRVGVSLTFDYWGRPKAAWTVPDPSLDDASLAELADLTSLRALNLCGTKVTDAGIPHLKRLAHLRYLNVGGLPLTDASISELLSLDSLRYLDLFGTKATPLAIAAFAAERPSVTIRVKAELIRQAASSSPKSTPPLLTIEPAKFPY
jgi:hypothetical protein